MIAYFIFYNEGEGKTQWWTKGQKFKHTNVIMSRGDHWILMTYIETGLCYRIFIEPSGDRIVERLSMLPSVEKIVAIEMDEEQKHKPRWWPLWVPSCNEYNRLVTGINSGFSWNPGHFYKKLINNKHPNYVVLWEWRRQHADGWK